MSKPRGWHLLLAVTVVAIVSSAIHYADNTINWTDYPHPSDDSRVPDPAAWIVAVSWLGFTAVGLLGLRWYSRHRIVAAAVAIALYSGSGLVSIGHYLVPGATSMPAWRQTSVVADIVLGALLFGFALWAVLRVRLSPASPDTAR